jgi:hydrogenase/urease accessory protein HupE
MSQAATAPLPPPDARTVLDRLGGWRGVVDGAVPPALFVAGSTGAGLLGHDERALPTAAAAAAGSAVALGIARLARGHSLAGVVRGSVGLALAVGFALWTGHARDFFLPGIAVDGLYAAALSVSVLAGRPAIGYAYAALFRAPGWRSDRRLRRVLARATLGWAVVYLLRFAVQLLFYGTDQPELLALAKLALGWPLTAGAVIVTIRVVREVLRNR